MIANEGEKIGGKEGG